ncbi:glucose 1-dehydrogenase [Saccharothrix coeruleofusca]|uniref:Oxidoreductase n=1 Tax=Saccharothrix coeruleofusca TaxID=33919 RepID=A0A918ASZ3_9PSEU|nr:glucose 1-dehydrogenase [Saccharothrix coeruleofusca]MBP2335583.1 3-oxoacyl-[acyl-carrier protein] reductase [Saccharothrix coeruleofusca]GGP79576.1 oxidoreductase [Saccharothrix coeruleofusca]
MLSLDGRVALVTGASRGIGAGIATALAEAGAAVVVNYVHDQRAADRVVRGIEAGGGRAVAIRADVSSPTDVSSLFAAARGAFGVVDVLVNNAGVYSFAPFDAVSPQEFHRQFDINVLGSFLTMREFAAAPEADGGAIINLSTAGVSTLSPFTALYAASKSAITAATVVVARELAVRDIRVNAIAPTGSDTEGTRDMGFVGSPAHERMAAEIPLGRLGVPEDIAPVAVFLASSAARFITGEVIFASGGHR